MKRNLAYVILLLFISFTTVAKAEDQTNYLVEKEKHKRKAEKILGLLKVAGLSHPLIKDATYYVQENTRDDYFYFTQKEYKNLNLGFRHELGTPKLERLELYMQADDSNYVYTLSTEAVMVRYKVDFEY